MAGTQDMTAAPLLSIVIPTWNGRALLEECLASLRAQTFVGFEIVVVDDASTDNTAAWLTEAHPDVRIVRLPKNHGFCGAANAGLRAASGVWIFLLNNDMTLAPDALTALMAAADSGEADILGPLVLWRDAPDTIYAAGDRLLINGRPESIGYRAPVAGFPLSNTVFGITAGAALYRREVFARIGLFDEYFGSYFEDADLSFRARLAGFRAALVPEARAWHVGSASLAGRNWLRSRQCYRNHALLVAKNFPTRLLLRYFPSIARERLHQARMLVSAARTEFGLAHALRVLAITWCSLVAALPHAFLARWRIQRARVLRDSDLVALLSQEKYS